MLVRRFPFAPGFIILWVFHGSPGFAQDLQPSAIQQIQTVLQEKAGRTPAQQKLDSHVHLAGQLGRGALSAATFPALRAMAKGLAFDGAGNVHVDIHANVNAALLTAIATLGGKVESAFPEYNEIRAWIPLLNAETLAGRSDVIFIRPAEISVRAGNIRRQLNAVLPAIAKRKLIGRLGFFTRPVDTSGEISEGANLVQTAGITGAGIKVGVLSDGVNSLSQLQGLGDLPAVTVLSGQAGSGDEGTAMLEIVYDLAPGAALYFATAGSSQTQFANNIKSLASAGCNIIVDDYSFINEGAFQDGTVAQAVNTVTTSGVLYFSAAGNSGNLDSGTSGTWEGDFVNSGTSISIINSSEFKTVPVHSFGSVNYDAVATEAPVACLVSGADVACPTTLKWSDPLGASCNDYDLFILDSTGSTVLDHSTNRQTCFTDPYEVTSNAPAAGNRIVIVLYSGAARALRVDTNRGRLSVATSGATFGHNAAAAALTVAATPAQSTIFSSGQQSPETYSSDGPRKIFYNPNGTAITAGNFLFGTNGGTTLSKVDFTAADCGQSAVTGFNPFCGTSAATPTAAAIAALLWSESSAQTASQVAARMKATALPAQSAFNTRTVGSGIVIATNATTVTNVTSSTANGSYRAGAAVSIQVTFSGTVTVTGTPQLALNSGGTATYSSGSGSTTLTFNYTVVAGQNSARLDYASTSALTLNGGAINDANSLAAVLTLPAPGASGSLSFNKNIVIDTTAPTVANVTSSTANGAYITGQSISIQIVFSATVNVTGTPKLALNSGGTANYSSGSGNSTLTFTYTIAAGDTSTHLDYSSTSALTLNGGTINDVALNPAVLTLAAPGAAGSLGANTSFLINPAPATVTNVTSSTANGSYRAGSSVVIQVTFSGTVTVTGTPQLALNSGGTATYSSGSGGATLTFVYTVAAGQNSARLDYSSTTALTVNGGAIIDANNLAAVLTLPAPGASGSLSANKSIVIDTIAPTVANVTSSTANGTYITGQSISIQVAFSETVNVTGSPRLALNSGGTASYSSGSGSSTLTFTYLIGVGEISAHLDYSSTGALTLNGGAINDTALNPAVLTLTAPGGTGSLGVNTRFVINPAPTTVTNVTSSTVNGSYRAGSLVSIQVSFSGTVTVVGIPLLALNSGGVAIYSSGSGATTLTFIYTVVAGQNSARLDYTSTGALTLNGGVITDANGLAAVLALPSPGASGSLSFNKSIVIDTIAPAVTNVTSSTANGIYTTGQSISIQVGFSQTVIVTGTPKLALNSGGTAYYSSGSGGTTLTFIYVIGAGEAGAHLDYIPAGALALNGGAITDVALNPAVLTLVAPGAAGSLGANSNFVINLNSTYAISGQVTFSGSGLSGMTVTLGGSQSGSTTTNASGNYSFSGLPVGGSYTITPSGSGYAFSPISLSVNILSANQVANFTGTSVAGLDFYSVTPCRVADTRTGAGFPAPFGPPSIAGGTSRAFPIPASSCGIPATAAAYSLNVTVAPHQYLGVLIAWPTGQSMPNASTLNSYSGTVVANAAIVPAGSPNGEISIYVTDTTDVLFDINGYFAPPLSSGLEFYPATPCRVADTRAGAGFPAPFGPPTMTSGTTRTFPIPSGSCGIPATAAAYSLNVTVAPVTPPGYLGYLTIWPAAQPIPVVSTLNSYNGAVVANAAIVPAGKPNEAIDIYVTDPTDVLFDINGYFAPPLASGLHFYPASPCRVADTRSGAGFSGPFGPPSMAAATQRAFPIPSGTCGIPASAAAYSLNVTVVPQGYLGYLSIWPTGQPLPVVSTLNSYSGAVVANAAIVPAGAGGAISIYVTDPTDVLFDIDGYFAP